MANRILRYLKPELSILNNKNTYIVNNYTKQNYGPGVVRALLEKDVAIGVIGKVLNGKW